MMMLAPMMKRRFLSIRGRPRRMYSRSGGPCNSGRSFGGLGDARAAVARRDAHPPLRGAYERHELANLGGHGAGFDLGERAAEMRRPAEESRNRAPDGRNLRAIEARAPKPDRVHAAHGVRP